MTPIRKDPWLAVNLSMFFPGIGQFYARQWVKGLLFLLVQVGLLAITLWSIFSAEGNPAIGLLYFCLAVGVYLVNILDAHLGVYYPQRDVIAEKIPRTNKNPWFAVFASRVLPGLGHLYSNQSVIGLSLLSSSLILLKLDDYYPALLAVTPTLAAIATYHTYLAFPKRPAVSQRSLVAAIAGLVFLVSLVGNYLPQWLDRHFEVFVIPSESMQPTLQIGDRVLVHLDATYAPQAGDIVVFRPSQALEQMAVAADDYLIKRVLATPGQTVAIRQGSVYINQQRLQEDYLAQPPEYEWEPQTVPENAYFLLGDNRNASLDSHVWGFLPHTDIVGRAYKICWPISRVRSLIDPDV